MSRRGSSSRKVTPKYTTSPKTGREIEIGGKTYLELSRNPTWADKLTPKPTAAQRRGSSGHSYSNSTKGGCSNQAKYRNEKIPRNEFCGPSGGACERTFPSNTRKRAVSSLTYRRHAPNPAGIEECVIRIAKKKGWYDAKTGTIKIKAVTQNPRRASKRKSNTQLSKKTTRGSAKRKHYCGCSAI